jgi:hypothetical protein
LFETLSPVVKQSTVRIILCLAVHYHWPCWQLDVSNAFFHGLITEDVYMRQPLGYKDPSHPHYVCKLTKALYGLKQAPRAWYAMFSSEILTLGFVSSKADTSFFVFHSASHITIVLVYVDHIVITSSDSAFVEDLIKSLSSKFVMKEKGALNFFLGIEVSSTSYSPAGTDLLYFFI